MPFPVTCSCGQRFLAQDWLAGKQADCPSCGTQLLIQRPQQPVRRAAAPAPSPTSGGIAVTCVCGRSYQAGPQLAGRTVRCTACGHVLQVPGGQQAWNAPSWVPASTPTYNYGLPSQPLPTQPTNLGPYAPPRKAEPDSNFNVKIVLAIAIAVSLLAIVLGVVFTVLRSGETPVATNDASSTSSSSSSDTTVAEADNTAPMNANDGATVSATESETQAGQSDQSSATSSQSATPSYNPTPPGTSASTSPYASRANAPYGPAGANPNTNEVVNADPSGAQPTALGNVNSQGAVGSTEGSNTATVARSVSLPESLLRWEKQPTRVRAGLRRVQETGMPQMQYSWMCELLPHLGHQQLYDGFDFSLPWSDDANLQLTGEVVPQFLKPGDTRERFEGYPFRNMALSHFAGMSGVEDRRNVVAAQLPRTDPRAGVFGYDDVAEMRDITDGAGNTIMLVESGQLAAPWALGGGGTIRGAREPYFDKISGFGSSGGALVVMADGSVRHVSANVSPSVFRALSTIHGGETVDLGTATRTAELK